LKGVEIDLPPLRERREDVPQLAGELLRDLGRDLKRGPLTLSEAAVARLQGHSWPGNIRELRNVLERAALGVRQGEIAAGDLRFDEMTGPEAGGQTLQDVERQEIVRALDQERGRVVQAARRLGVPRSTLYVKIRTYGIDLERYKP
jgi:DNA-binding NtrC family response regulator